MEVSRCVCLHWLILDNCHASCIAIVCYSHFNILCIYLLEIMREVEAGSWRDCISLQQGRVPNRARRASAVTNDRRIASLTRQLVANEIPVHTFLRNVSGTVYNIMRGSLNAEGNRNRPCSPERGVPPPRRRLGLIDAVGSVLTGKFSLHDVLLGNS